MSACPTCGKEVDALRARNVKVRGIQVVAYCSPECLAAAGDSTATAAPRATPAQGVVKQGVAPDSGPVIEIRYEPASGVVTSAKDERKTPPPQALDAVAAAATAESDSKKSDDKKKSEKKADKKHDDKRETKSERRPVLKIIEEAGGQPRDIKAPKNETPKGVEPEKISPAKLSDAAAARPAVSGRRASRDTLKRDHANVDQAEDWLDDEPANPGESRPETELGDEPPPRSGANRALLWLLLLALIAGGGALAYKFLYLDRKAPAAKPGSGSAGSSAATVGSGSNPSVGSGSQRAVGQGSGSQAEDALSTDAIRERALGVLRGYLTDHSNRVQRMAAAALARTGDQPALDRLAAALGPKNPDKLEESARLEVAYYLARAGEKRGFDAIAASLVAPRRDDKLAAGRLLVQLGDMRAVNTLAPYLEVPQHRLSAAELLARLGEARAIKVLEQVRADPNATQDEKNRALIGLAYAGKSGLADELRALLADNHFNAFAAEALAQKRDEAARPILVKQLEVTSLRVAAARAIRTLSPDGDQMPYVKTLLAALDDPSKKRDTEHIPIAEAILLLIGPIGWAERT
jgi:HEAT repeat protein